MSRQFQSQREVEHLVATVQYHSCRFSARSWRDTYRTRYVHILLHITHSLCISGDFKEENVLPLQLSTSQIIGYMKWKIFLRYVLSSLIYKKRLTQCHITLCYIGINNFLLKWICHYLLDRKQRVVLNGRCSESSAVTSGVPQGSVLGPLLFLIYFDGITGVSLSLGSSIDLYADNLLLYRIIRDERDFISLQMDIDKVADWIGENHVSLNISKCKSMVISHKRIRSVPEESLQLDGQPPEQVEEFKYLGVILNSTLNWFAHIQSVCSKACRLVGYLFRTFAAHSNSPSLQQL